MRSATPSSQDAQRQRPKSREPLIAALCEAIEKTAPTHGHHFTVARDLRLIAGELPASHLTQAHVDTVLASWANRYPSPHTRHTKRKYLRYVLATLHAAGAPILRVPKGIRPKPRGVTASPEEIAALLAAAKPWEQLLIMLCWQTAIRSGEATKLRVCDWNHATTTLTIVAKGKAHRAIPATPPIARLLDAAAAGAHSATDTAFTALRGKSITKPGVNTAWCQLRKRAGVLRDVRLHDLRRTTATALYNATKDIRAVQDYLGHSNLASTTHYLAPLGDTKLRELQNLLAFQSEVRQ